MEPIKDLALRIAEAENVAKLARAVLQLPALFSEVQTAQTRIAEMSSLIDMAVRELQNKKKLVEEAEGKIDDAKADLASVLDNIAVAKKELADVEYNVKELFAKKSKAAQGDLNRELAEIDKAVADAEKAADRKKAELSASVALAEKQADAKRMAHEQEIEDMEEAEAKAKAKLEQAEKALADFKAKL